MKKIYIVLAAIMLFTLCFQSSAIELVKVETRAKTILKVDGLEFRISTAIPNWTSMKIGGAQAKIV